MHQTDVLLKSSKVRKKDEVHRCVTGRIRLFCHTKVLVLYKIVESELNNILPGTSEMTAAESCFCCSRFEEFEDYQIILFLALI